VFLQSITQSNIAKLSNSNSDTLQIKKLAYDKHELFKHLLFKHVLMKKASGKQTLRGLATVNFYAADVKAAKKWYSELLGIEPYFERPGSEQPAYIEFRLGDYQHELGIIDKKYAPKAAAAGPGGAVAYWHVDDVAATLEKVTAMGAKEYEPLTKHGEAGFITASVVDPFGNILGIMYNPHYLEILGSTKREN
jgi:predicted enzyme related to lactoylglutathione lyase